MKWTLNTYEVGQEWDVDHLIEMCAKTGYPYIEFLMDFKQPHGLEWDTPRERYAEVKGKLDALLVEAAKVAEEVEKTVEGKLEG